MSCGPSFFRPSVPNDLTLVNPMEDSSVLILYKMPSYLISLLEVKLIKLPMYESADELEDLEVSVAIVL